MGRSSEPLARRLTHHVESAYHENEESTPRPVGDVSSTAAKSDPRAMDALKQLFCGGLAGSVAKTVTAPLSRLTILYQVHPMVTTKENRPKFSMTLSGGISKIVERGGVLSLWKGNGTSVLHRFPFSAINFYCYEGMLDILIPGRKTNDDEDINDDVKDESKLNRLIAGGVAGLTACVACYPLDLVRTRLTTQLDGQEHYKGITDAFVKIVRNEGFLGLYSGIAPTLMVAVPSFSISYMVYGK
jgi:solute carrier family 25 phosphate transporter 23/24/25/41